MFMFLPFLLALILAVAAIRGRTKAAVILWCVLMVVTLASFSHHATDALNLSF